MAVEGAGEFDAGVVGGEGFEFLDVGGEFGEFAVDGEFYSGIGGERADGVDEDVAAFVFGECADEGDAELGGCASVGVAGDAVGAEYP